MSVRWLLMLGSNLATDARVRDAVVALGGLGSVGALTEIRPTPARQGGGTYFNQLVSLESGVEADTLKGKLKAIEVALGRVRDGSGVVAIDIDLLARDAGDGWQPDPRAQAKGEFMRPPAPELLAEARIGFS